MRRLVPSLALLLCLSLAACGGDDAGSAPAASSAGSDTASDAMAEAAEDAPPPMPTGDFRIVSLTLGKDVDSEGQVRQALDRFAPTDKVFAAVVGVGSSDGLTLSARWTRSDGTEVAKAGQSLSPTTPTVTTFSITQPEPWPAGDYRVEIAINDQVAEARDFRIE